MSIALVRDEGQAAGNLGSGWRQNTGSGSNKESGHLEIQRERSLTESNNLGAIAAAVANSGAGKYVDPAVITNGIQRIRALEAAWLVPDSCLVARGRVRVRGEGVSEVTLLLQKRTVEASVTLGTETVFEYLAVGTDVSE